MWVLRKAVAAEVTVGLPNLKDEQPSPFHNHHMAPRRRPVPDLAGSSQASPLTCGERADGKPSKIGWHQNVSRYVYSMPLGSGAMSDRVRGDVRERVTEVQGDGRIPESRETGA
ncbi:hypothetical protein GCM10010349_60910 [Streptomyces flavofungini]|nr:hypothetical protein GCM10010349_60910 [Streptomyces flavofungini]